MSPKSPAEWREARQLIEEYAASLGVDLCFQNIGYELEHLPDEYGPPGGAFFLAGDSGLRLGCVGVRRLCDEEGEIKRLYVVPAARGRGVGRLLAQAAVDAGRRLGFRRLVLDTLPSMTAAQSLYVSLGFKRAAAYRFNPIDGTVYMVLELSQGEAAPDRQGAQDDGSDVHAHNPRKC